MNENCDDPDGYDEMNRKINRGNCNTEISSLQLRTDILQIDASFTQWPNPEKKSTKKKQ